MTAHNEYAVEAFEVHAVDYLVKPIEKRRLEQALARVKENLRLQEAFAARQEISSALMALQTAAGTTHTRRGCWQRTETRTQ